jgi:integrase
MSGSSAEERWGSRSLQSTLQHAHAPQASQAAVLRWQDKPMIAGRLRQNIGAVLDYATVSGLRAGPNPARWKGNLEILLGQQKDKSEHRPAMAYVELPAFMKRLRAIEGVPARALEVTIFAAARTGETRLATWDEIDLPNAVWTVPASRMKARKQHRVPLSKRAVELLKALPRDAAGSYVFIGAKDGAPMGSTIMIRLLQELVGSGVSVHGFRASFRTWVAEQTSTAEFVAEHALAHVVGDASKRAYQRSDLFVKRRKLMQQWADFIDTAAVGEVTPLRRAS